jgi:hypothetical protein
VEGFETEREIENYRIHESVKLLGFYITGGYGSHGGNTTDFLHRLLTGEVCLKSVRRVRDSPGYHHAQ